MPKRCSDAQLEAAWAARDTRPDLSTFKSDEAKHGAMAEWVESWGGAALTNPARRALWWKQSKKHHAELCAKQRARLEQLGELVNEAPAATQPVAAISFDGASSSADGAASQALTALVAFASSTDDASAIAPAPTAASDAAVNSSVTADHAPSRQPQASSTAETVTSQTLAEAAPSQQPPPITADTAASRPLATADPCSTAAIVTTASDAAGISATTAAAAPSQLPAPYDLRRPLQPGARWINRNAPNVSKLTAPPAVPTPTGRHAMRKLSAVVTTPSGEGTAVQEGEVCYSLPPQEGERESAAQRREKRHRDREEEAIRRLQLEAAKGRREPKAAGADTTTASASAAAVTTATAIATAPPPAPSAATAPPPAPSAATSPLPPAQADQSESKPGLPKLPRRPERVVDPEEDTRRQAEHERAHAEAMQQRQQHAELMTARHAKQKATAHEDEEAAMKELQRLQYGDDYRNPFYDGRDAERMEIAAVSGGSYHDYYSSDVAERIKLKNVRLHGGESEHDATRPPSLLALADCLL